MGTYREKRFIWEEDESDDSDGDDLDDTCKASVADVRRSSYTIAADTARATGTLANVTGAASHLAASGISPAIAPIGSAAVSSASMLAHVCAPLSVVGGAVGMASGVSQLHCGLTAPSGNIDPHLVTKGGVTTGVGGTCMMLGVGAIFVPVLFFVALGLGVGGLATATMIDASMSGLCSECRLHRT